METKKVCLTERQMPTQWYNIVADMPNKPLPPLHPGTKKPVTKEQMSAIFAEELIDQEMSTERYIDIPEEVQEIYRIWRPTPLVRATGLEKALGTPAKIFFKNESVSPAGSHKPNTAVPQAYYNYKQGIKHLTTETGAERMHSRVARVLTVPETETMLLPQLGVVPLQLLAYYIALARGCDIDKPRNLAKSVTVE